MTVLMVILFPTPSLALHAHSIGPRLNTGGWISLVAEIRGTPCGPVIIILSFFSTYRETNEAFMSYIIC